MPTPSPKPSPIGRRSFNQSMAEWNEGRRGPAPSSVWGARAVEALKPWEDHEMHLVMAVALAIEAAYLEGKEGKTPRMPDVREDLRPGEHAPVDVPVSKRKVVVRHAAPAPMKTVTHKGVELTQRDTEARPKKPALAMQKEGTVAGYTRVIKEATLRDLPAKAPARRVVIRK